MPMKVLDMFCGMSAFRTAAELIGGFSFIGHCDNDPTAVATYRTLYKTEGEYFCNDARAVNTDEIPDFDLLVGGFPCVAFSAAGARRAFDDPRGTLFFELSRILEAKYPAYFIFENVPPIRTICEGRVFTAILSELSRLGYLCEWQCIDGAAYLPQTRKRVFLVGYFDPRCAGEILPIERKGGKSLSELTDHQPQGKRVYDAGGAAITQTASCGGFGGRTGLYLVDYNENSKFTDTARCITAQQDSGMSHHKGEHPPCSSSTTAYIPSSTPTGKPSGRTARAFAQAGLRHIALPWWIATVYFTADGFGSYTRRSASDSWAFRTSSFSS